MSADNIVVAVKARPLLKREVDKKLTSQWRIRGNTIESIRENSITEVQQFCFDHIFEENASTQEVFDVIARPIVDASLKGFNGTIFAYGQTSSGKTYTMLGNETEPGITQLAVRELYKEMKSLPDRLFTLRVGYIEIYNEKIYDLLDKANQDLKIHESDGGVYVNNTTVEVLSEEEIMKAMYIGNKIRKTGETNMNERSSRSHTIFTITIETRDATSDHEDTEFQTSNLNLIDLAGSERADQTGAKGSRFKEGSHINKSLLSLSLVIQKLSENDSERQHINYRDSKLTRILQASLGGNAMTAIVCNITKAALDETYSTLSFANRAKRVKIKPTVNEVVSDAVCVKRLTKKVVKLEQEIEELSARKASQFNTELLREIMDRKAEIKKIKAVSARRKTWCPSYEESLVTIGQPEDQNNSDVMPPPSVIPKPTHFYVSNIYQNSVNMNREIYTLKEEEDEEHFQSINDFNFNEDFSPGKLSVKSLALQIHTPKLFRRSEQLNDSSPSADLMDDKMKIKYLENELRELQDFTNLESKLHVNSDIVGRLKYELGSAREQVERYKERIEELTMSNLLSTPKRKENDSSLLENELKSVKSAMSKLQSEYDQLSSELMDNIQENDKLKQSNNDYEIVIQHLSKTLTDTETRLQTELDLQLAKNLDLNEQKAVDFERIKFLENSLREHEQNYIEEISKRNERKDKSIEMENILSAMILHDDTVIMSLKLSLNQLETEYSQLIESIGDIEYTLDTTSVQITAEPYQHPFESIRVQQLEDENMKLRTELKLSVDEKMGLEKYIDNMRTSNDEIENDCKSLRAMLKENEKLIEFSEMRTSEYNIEIRRLSEKCLMLESEVTNLNSEQLVLKEQLEMVRYEKWDADTRIRELKEDYSRFENDILIAQSNYEKTVENLRNDKYSLVTELKTYKNNQNEMLGNMLRNNEEKLREYAGKNEKLEEELSTARDERRVFEMTIKNVQDKYDKLIGDYELVKSELESKSNRCDELIASLNELQNILQQRNDEFDGKNEMQSELEKSLRDIRTEHNQCESIIVTLRKSLQSVEQTKESESSVINEMEMKIKSITDQITDQNETILKLQQQLADRSENLDEALKAKFDLQKILSNSCMETNKLQSEIRRLNETIETLNNDLQTNSHLVNDIQKRLDEQERQTENIIKSKEDVEHRLATSLGMNEIEKRKYNEIVKEFEEKLNDKTIEIQSKIDIIFELQTDLNQTQSLLTTEKEFNTDIVRKHQCSLTDLTNLQTKHTNLEKDFQKSTEKLINEHLAKLNQKITELSVKDQTLSNLERRINEKTNQISYCEEVNATLEQQNVELRSKIESNDTEIFELNKRLAQKLSDFEELQKSKSDIEIKYSQNLADFEELRKSKSEIEINYDNVAKQLKEQQNNYQLIKIKIDREEAEKDSNKSGLSDLQRKIDQTIKELDDKTKQIKELNELVDKNERTKLSMSNILQEQMRNLKTLEEEKEGLKADNKQLSLKINCLEGKLKELHNIEETYVELKRDYDIKLYDISKLEQEYKELETIKLNLGKNITNIEFEFAEVTDRHKRLLEKYKALELTILLKENEIKLNLKGEYDELKSRNQKLVLEVDDLRRNLKEDRKNRRQSTHDETRQSMWGSSKVSVRTIELQTDPTDQLCACREMDDKLKNLMRELLIKDCQIGNMKMMTDDNPLREELEDLKKQKRNSNLEIHSLRSEIDKLSVQLERASGDCKKCLQTQLKLNKADASSQSEIDESYQNELMALRKNEIDIKKKYADIKILFRLRHDEIKSLKNEVSSLKDQLKRINQTHLDELNLKQANFVSLEQNYRELEAKYGDIESKHISACEEIVKLNSNVTSLENLIDCFKATCESQNAEIESLKVSGSGEKENARGILQPMQMQHKANMTESSLDLTKLREENKTILDKYTRLKEMYSELDYRYRINFDNTAEGGIDYYTLKKKYEKAKFMCEARNNIIKHLEEKLMSAGIEFP